jgi:hypothetical protein
MSDLTSITGLITAAGSVIGLANKVNTVEANQKIIGLQQRLADVQQFNSSTDLRGVCCRKIRR